MSKLEDGELPAVPAGGYGEELEPFERESLELPVKLSTP